MSLGAIFTVGVLVLCIAPGSHGTNTTGMGCDQLAVGCPAFDPAEPVSVSQLAQMWEPFEYAATPARVAELNAALLKYEIDTIAKVRLFMAKVTLESDHGLRVAEAWGPTYHQSLYQGSMGNTENGDAEKFKGAGYVMLRGRASYASFAVDMADPKILELGSSYVAAEYPAAAAGHWWAGNGINEFVDRGADIYNVTAMVYRGFDHISDLIELYERSIRIWTHECEPAPPPGFCLAGVAGECIDTEHFQCEGGALKTGYCRGGASTRCCPAPGKKVANPTGIHGKCRAGEHGTCIDANLIGCSGQLLRGHCPGGASVLCCPSPHHVTELPAEPLCDHETSCSVIPLDLKLISPAVSRHLSTATSSTELEVEYSKEIRRAADENSGAINAELAAKHLLVSMKTVNGRLRRGSANSWIKEVLDGFWYVVRAELGEKVYTCGSDIYGVVKKIISMVQGNIRATLSNVLELVKDVARTVLDCSRANCGFLCSAAEWVTNLVGKIGKVISTYRDCRQVYDNVVGAQRNGGRINWRTAGKGIGQCVIDIKDSLRRRKSNPLQIGPRALIRVPDGWLCEPMYFDDGDVCDQGCGNIIDPDCQNPTLPLSKARWHGVTDADAAPEGWRCPPIFFGAGDGCDICGNDVNTGPVDPDCMAPNATVFRWNDPAHDFSMELDNVDNTVRRGATTTEACHGFLVAAGVTEIKPTVDPTPSFASPQPHATSDSADESNVGLKVAIGMLAVLSVALLGICIGLAMMLRASRAQSGPCNPYLPTADLPAESLIAASSRDTGWTKQMKSLSKA